VEQARPPARSRSGTLAHRSRPAGVRQESDDEQLTETSTVLYNAELPDTTTPDAACAPAALAHDESDVYAADPTTHRRVESQKPGDKKRTHS